MTLCKAEIKWRVSVTIIWRGVVLFVIPPFTQTHQNRCFYLTRHIRMMEHIGIWNKSQMKCVTLFLEKKNSHTTWNKYQDMAHNKQSRYTLKYPNIPSLFWVVCLHFRKLMTAKKLFFFCIIRTPLIVPHRVLSVFHPQSKQLHFIINSQSLLVAHLLKDAQ